ncbi:flagellar hook-length control protein FliK [Aliiglaciecola sp. CAU 1673]|uniref:flagellar hook-length control protein FliK n=1 Tax=Aliiglaciecola sp. CAU 1673 TaxID=3032595 RepID=UPI0023DAC720|nr:flagellar hook-length control protein FliK [Aliiglaciecola sp. CAU 1673]MDF2177484.1 flagellar hook-length control protein FliK [Aliiglaciecola sp. CAU 1673]
MTDLQFSPQQQLASALKQMQSGAPIEASTRNAVPVLVKEVSIQQVLMISGGREVRAGIRDIQGSLTPGREYQVAQETGNAGRLQFFSAETARLPQQTLNYPLPKALAQAITTETILALSQKQPGAMIMQAEVIEQKGNLLTVQLPSGKLELPLPKDSGQFSPAQKLTLELLPKGDQWQLRISQSPEQPTPRTSSAQLPLQIVLPRALQHAVGELWLSERNSPPMDRQQLAQMAKAQGTSVPQALQQLLDKTTLIAQQTRQEQPSLRLLGGNLLEIKAPTTPIPQAVITLQKADLPKLSALLSQATANTSGAQNNAQAMPLSVDTSSPQGKQPVTAVNIDKTQASSGKVIAQETSDKVASTRMSENAAVRPTQNQAAGAPLSSMQTQYQQLVSLSRQLQIVLDAPQQALVKLEQSLNPTPGNPPGLAPLLQQLKQDLTQSLPRGKDIHQDVESLRQLLSAAALPVTPVTLNSPPPSQGLLGGLMVMLQVALASRLSRSLPSQGAKLAEGLASLISHSKAMSGQAPMTPKQLSDFSQVEQRHQIIRQLGQLLSSHSASKTTSADLQWQGQDVFHYSLPGISSQRHPLEILIRREPPSEERRQQAQSTDKQWQLSMKLEVGEIGALLAKAKLFQEQLELDFYAGNQQVREKVDQYLPVLIERLEALGLTVHRSQCQLGKIPEHLQQRPYHLFETKA